MLKKLKARLFLIFILIISFGISCVNFREDDEFNNPVDPESPNYNGVPSVDLDGDGISSYIDVDDIIIISPADGTVTSDGTPPLIVYKFNPSLVETYHIQISTSENNFENNIVHQNNNISSNYYAIPSGVLEINTTYYWRAKAYDGIKWSDNWSEIFSFTLDITIQIPTLPFPINNSTIIYTTPDLDWEDVYEATGYHIQVNTESDFSGILIVDEDTISESQYEVTTVLENNITYYWRVRIKNEDGVWGDWSSTWNFSIKLEFPTIPSPLSDSNIGDTTPLLDWENISSALGYHIQVSEVIDFSSAIIENDDTLTPSEYQIVTPVTNNTTYYWRVRIKNDDGVWGDWSSVFNFTIDTSPPNTLFTVSKGVGWPVNGDIDVDASASSDSLTPSSELQVRWDWESDGGWDTVYSTIKTASHIYITAGTKTIKLEVKDNDGFTSTDTQQVTLDEYLKWGSAGSGDGQFSFIDFSGEDAVIVDSSDNVYVADDYNNRIQKFDSSGNFILKWGSSGEGDGQFVRPTGVAVDSSGNVYVADFGNHRMQKFDSSGNFILKWGSRGSGDRQFNYPNGVAVDSSGNVYVGEEGNHRIQKFDSSGNFILKWGSKGSEDGQFNYPKGVAVDSSGYVYVADGQNSRIQKFNSSGVFINKWGILFNSFGVAVDSSGYVYVSEFWGSEDHIKKFDSSGNFILIWGSTGSEDGQFNGPTGVAVDSSGNIYVVDCYNDRIHKFGMLP